MIAKNNRIVLLIVGAMTEVATLKKALSEAENRAAAEHTEGEAGGAGGGGAERAPGSHEKTRELGA